MSERGVSGHGPEKMALAVYVLYALGVVFTLGLLSIAGVVLAYINQGDAAGSWVESHFRWQIRTFWIGVLYSIVAGITMFIGIGFILYIVIGVWVIVRVALGWSQLSKEQPVPRPESWFF